MKAKQATVLLLSELPDAVVRTMSLIPVHSLEEALDKAYRIVGENPTDLCDTSKAALCCRGWKANNGQCSLSVVGWQIRVKKREEAMDDGLRIEERGARKINRKT